LLGRRDALKRRERYPLKEGVKQVMKLAASDVVVPVLSLHKFG
jgi:hypothetical protein